MFCLIFGSGFSPLLAQYPRVTMMVRDPVCNMNVNADKPGAVEKYGGKTYYFCSNKCKTTFDKNRDKFSGNL